MPTLKDFKHFLYTSHLSYTHKNMWKRKLSLDSVKNYYTLAAFIGGISSIQVLLINCTKEQPSMSNLYKSGSLEHSGVL